MAVISKPIIFLAIFAAAASIYVWSQPEPVAAKVAKKRVAKTAFDGWDFPPPDPGLRLPKPKNVSRDVFLPKVKVQRVIRVAEAKDDLVAVPANLAGGEGGWAYTGMAEVDGVRMALLENSGTKQSGYVREGEDWKKAHVVGITTACIVLSDEKGTAQTIYRFNPNDPPKVKPLPNPGFAPLNPGGVPTGPIGGAIRPIASSPNFPPPTR
jgi:hypothetical protein